MAGALWALLSPARTSARRRAAAAVLLGLWAWVLLLWAAPLPAALGELPPARPPAQIAALFAAGALLAAAAFAAAGGRGNARLGASVGLASGAIGACVSRWPALARAVEFCGAAFAGPALAFFLPFGLAATAGLLAAALLGRGARSRLLLAAAVAAWAVSTWTVEAALTRCWGYGPRSLSAAADVADARRAPRAAVLWLSPGRRRSIQFEPRRLEAGGVAATPRDLERLEAFLRRTGGRDVFAAQALAVLRRGWLQLWEVDRALDAASLAVPGRARPDYRGALDLIKAGPLTAERYGLLRALDAETARSSAGFEDVEGSQILFEGFSAAYARFGDEEGARRWLERVDRLWPLSGKKLEVTPLQDFRSGRVSGSLLVDGRPSPGVRVGLFLIWESTGPGGGAYSRLLSASALPDEDGRFSFSDLGAGRYQLALLARSSRLRGRAVGSPGVFVLDEVRPRRALPPIRLERGALPAPETSAPDGSMDESVPIPPEAVLRWPRR